MDRPHLYSVGDRMRILEPLSARSAIVVEVFTPVLPREQAIYRLWLQAIPGVSHAATIYGVYGEEQLLPLSP